MIAARTPTAMTEALPFNVEPRPAADRVDGGRFTRDVAVQYALAVALVAAAHVITVLSWNALGPAVYTIFLGAVVIAALNGGYGPGLLSTALASLDLAYTFMPPYHSFAVNFDDLLFVVTFTTVALLTSSLQSRRRSAEASLRRAHDELERRVASRTAELADSQERLGLLVRDLLTIAEREQLRIGHDLHDGLGQELTGIAMMSVALSERLRAGGSPATPHAEQVAGLIQEAIQHARELARGLSPIDLEDEGLAPALTRLADRVGRLPGVGCTFEAAGVPGTDASANIHLYRIAQEAINNALRHGQAKRLAVTLREAAGRVTLRVEDDGLGFPPDAAADGLAGGMGLRLMHYRARMIRAALTVERGPAGGTCVACEILQGREADHV